MSYDVEFTLKIKTGFNFEMPIILQGVAESRIFTIPARNVPDYG